jgi:hypothetical protein
MSIRNYALVAFILLCIAPTVCAQNTNSTYSRFGYGVLENPAMGKARGMGGVGYGYHDHGLLNVLNPASYADADTLNMLFDFGMSAQVTSFKEGALRQRNPNGYFDHVGMKFALKPNWGGAIGLVPYSKVGYSFKKDHTLSISDEDLSYTSMYSGTGGLNTFFVGTGWAPVRGLALGANLKYTFGLLTNTLQTVYTSSGINGELERYRLILRSPGLDLGAMFDTRLGKKGMLTLGAALSTSSPITGKMEFYEISSDTTEGSARYDFRLPNTLGLGLSYKWDNRLTVAFDYQNQAFSRATFMSRGDSLRDQNRIAIGAEYLPALNTERFVKAIRYRAGIQYSDLYLKTPGPLKAASLTLGLGLPLRNQPFSNQSSMVNLAFEVGRLVTPKASFIGETYYKLSLDVTFNEFWFFKTKL